MEGSEEMQVEVSIIIPVYNGSAYVAEAIESALSQTYPSCEVIVVNDGSDDGGQTKRIAESYGNHIRYYEKSNGGVASALNFGIAKMQGTYFSWLSHDDRYLPTKIAQQMEMLAYLPDKETILYGGYHLINDKGERYYEVNPCHTYSDEQLSKGLFPVFRGLVNGCTLLIHKNHFKRIGLFKENLKTTQDYDMWFRMFRWQQMKCHPIAGVETRIHDERGSVKSTNHIKEANDAWLEKMHRVTREEMQDLAGGITPFYQSIGQTLACFEMYKEAHDEAVHFSELLKRDVNPRPKVSIIMPFYNRINLVIESLYSALNQTYDNIEICMVDDASTEDISLLQLIIGQNPKIKYIRNDTNRGAAASRNRGIEVTTGEYIAFLDSDDLILPQKIEKQLEFMQQQQYVFSHTSYQRIDQQGKGLDQWHSGQMRGRVFPEIITQCLIATPTVMVRRDALGAYRFLEGMHVSEDICLWIDLAYRYELGGLDEVLSYVRISEETTWKDPMKVKEGAMNVLNYLFAHRKYLADDEAIQVFLENFKILFEPLRYKENKEHIG